MGFLVDLLTLHKKLEEKNLTQREKEIINRLISFYKETRKPNLNVALSIINNRIIEDSMFIGAESDHVSEDDALILKVRKEMKDLQAAKELIEKYI